LSNRLSKGKSREIYTIKAIAGSKNDIIDVVR
jgi:hypothetical protein